MDQKSKTLQDPAKTIDEVIIQLDGIIDQTVEADNFLCAFAYVYRQTTIEVKKGIETGRFEDGPRMEKMDVIFANLYISAYNNYQTSTSISRSWKYAFDAKKDNISLVQHILLGMNTHINMDLSIAAASVCDGKNIIDFKNDFMIINKILSELTNTMQKGLGRVSFMMRLLDFFGFRNDEKVINFSIKKARGFAWLNAVELSLLQGAKRNIRINEIDLRVLELSQMIKQPPGKFLNLMLKFITLFEEKNAKEIINKLSGA